jgi:hypothetical protein
MQQPHPISPREVHCCHRVRQILYHFRKWGRSIGCSFSYCSQRGPCDCVRISLRRYEILLAKVYAIKFWGGSVICQHDESGKFDESDKLKDKIRVDRNSCKPDNEDYRYQRSCKSDKADKLKSKDCCGQHIFISIFAITSFTGSRHCIQQLQ